MANASEPIRLAEPICSAVGAAVVPLLTFDEIYDTHFTFVWKNLRRLGLPLEHLEDASQDVFMVIHRHIADQSRYTSLKAWLCGISVRVAKDYRRRRHRKEGKLEPLSYDVVDVAQPTPFDNAAQAEAARLFESLVARLSDDHRTIFVLAEVEQMTARAIGEALGMNMNTVNSRLRAARVHFDKLVSEHEQGGEDAAAGPERPRAGRDDG